MIVIRLRQLTEAETEPGLRCTANAARKGGVGLIINSLNKITIYGIVFQTWTSCFDEKS